MACARPSDSDLEDEVSSDEFSSSSARSSSASSRPRAKTVDDNSTQDEQKTDEPFKRRSRTLTFRRKKNEKTKETSKKRNHFWTFRIKKKIPVRLKKKEHGLPLPEPTRNIDSGVCVCTGYRRTEDHVLGPGVIFSAARPMEYNSAMLGATASGHGHGSLRIRLMQEVPAPLPEFLDMSRLSQEEYPAEDIDELLIAQRASEIERGIDISTNRMSYPAIMPTSRSRSHSPIHEAVCHLTNALSSQCRVTTTTTYPLQRSDSRTFEESHIMDCRSLMSPVYVRSTVHTQVDYIHCMVPDLLRITGCGFYWGVMDRYEAERLLDNKPEGTFLLRDSAQEEYLFSVSFRRYGRSLHARIEQWNHKFSFDSHDPGVFSSNTVCGLIEHYKDPSCCMFFEPMLTLPLHRNFAFSLQHLCRAAICDRVSYDGASLLPLPKALRTYLQYYHYKQKVRVRQFDCQL